MYQVFCCPFKFWFPISVKYIFLYFVNTFLYLKIYILNIKENCSIIFWEYGTANVAHCLILQICQNVPFLIKILFYIKFVIIPKLPFNNLFLLLFECPNHSIFLLPLCKVLVNSFSYTKNNLFLLLFLIFLFKALIIVY